MNYSRSFLLLISVASTQIFSAPIETVTNTDDSGAGSLRQAVSDVDSSGTINVTGAGPFTPPVIELSTPIAVAKNFTLAFASDTGNAGVQAPGMGAGDIFELTNATITLDPRVSLDTVFIGNFTAVSGTSTIIYDQSSDSLYNVDSITSFVQTGGILNLQFDSPITYTAGVSNYTGSTTISNTFNLASGTSLANNSAFVLTGSGSLNLDSAGTQTIGSLASNSSSTSLALDSGSSINVGQDNSDTTFAGAITADTSATLTKQGTGVFTLSQGSTSSNLNLVVSDGTLDLTGNINASSGVTTNGTGIFVFGNKNGSFNSFNISNDSIVGINVISPNETTYGGIISSTGEVGKDGDGTFTFTNSQSYTGNTTVSAGTLIVEDLSDLSSVSVIEGATFSFRDKDGNFNPFDITNGGTVGILTDTGNTSSYSGTITGGTISKSAAGTFTLTSDSTNADSSINAGNLILAGNFDAGNTATIGANGTLTFDDKNGTYNSFAVANSGTVAFTTTMGNNTTYGGNITGTGNVTKSGAGTDVLSGTNTYSGTTTVSAGTLRASSTSGFSPNSAYTVEGILDVSVANTIGSLAGDGTVIIAPVTLSIGDDDTSTTFSGIITGIGNLEKIGTGTLILTGTMNDYQGTTTITGGTLQGAAASFPGNITNNANLTIDESTTTTFARNITGTGSLTKTGTGTISLSGTNTYSGGTTIQNGSISISTENDLGQGPGSINIDGGSLIISDTISGSRTYAIGSSGGEFDITDGATTFTTNSNFTGDGGLTKSGDGVMVIGGSNDYTGDTNIVAGTLRTDSTSALSSGSAYDVSGTLDVNNSNSIGSLSGDGTVDLADSTVLTTGGNDSSTSYDGIITGAGGFTKTGTGVLVLDGDCDYTGATTVESTGALGIVSNLSASTAVSITNPNATFIFGDKNGSFNSFNISNAGTVTFLADTGTTTTYGGNISSTGNVGKSDPGTVVLSGNNSYSGTTTVTTGTLQTGSTTALSSNSAFTVGGTLDVNHSNEIGSLAGDGTVDIATSVTLTSGGDDSTTSFSGGITGAGGFTKTGSGTLTLSGSNDYTGATTVSSTGTLQIDSNLSASSAVSVSSGDATFIFGNKDGSFNAFAISNAGTVSLTTDTGNTSTYAGNISSTGDVIKTGAGTFTLSGNNTYSGTTTISAGTVSTGSTTALSSNSAHTVDGILVVNNNNSIGSLAGSGTVNVADATVLTAGGDDSTTAYSGSISGLGGFTKAGSGTLTLSGTNDYSGATAISAGAITTGGTSALSSNSAHTINGTLNVENNNSIGSLAGSGTVNVADAIVLNAGGDDSSTSFSGGITGLGGFTKSGSGTLTLSGTNDYSGNTVISEGAITTDGTSALSSSSAFTVDATLNVNNNNSIGSLAGSGTINVADSTILTSGSDDSTTSYSGDITGLGGITKTGSGTLTLSGSNNYTGTTTVASTGALQVNGNLSASSEVTISSGDATFIFGNKDGAFNSFNISNGGAVSLTTDTGNTSTYGGAISSTGSVTKTGAGTFTLSGNNTYSGTTTISAGTVSTGSTTALSSNSAHTVNGTLAVNNNNSIGSLAGSGNVNVATSTVLTAGGDNTTTFFSGDITGAGGFTKAGSGTLTLSGTNDYSGETLISTGSITTGGTSALSSNSAHIVNGILNVNNSNSIGSLAGSGTVNVADSTVLTLGGNNTTTSYTGNLSGLGGITKTGSGTLTISGTNNYTGATTVGSTGTLLVDSDLSASTAVSVSSADATFAFGNKNGSFNAFAISNAGTVSLTTDTGNTSTYGGDISSTGSVTKTGGGTFTLSGNNTYSGTTTVSAGTVSTGSTTALSSNSAHTVNGTLTVNDNNSIGSLAGSGAVSIANSTVLTAGGDNTTTSFSGNISGLGGFSKVGSGTLSLSGTNNYSGASTISAGAITTGSTAALSSNSAYIVDSTLNVNHNNSIGSLAGSGTVIVADSTALSAGGNNSSTSFTGNITGLGGITKVGSGTLTLSGSNNYSGATAISAGAITTGGTASLSSNSAHTVNGTLNVENNNSIGSLAGSGVVNVADATILTAGGDNTTTSYSGDLSGLGGITKTGSGTLILSGSNDYTGATTVTSTGILQVDSDLSASSAVSVTSGDATFTFGNKDGTFNNFNIANAGTVSLTTDTGNTSTYAGNISSTGDVIKTGAGTFTLSGNNTYSGTTTISAGTVSTGSTTALSSNSAHTVNGTLAVNNNNSIGSIAGSGAISIENATILTTGGNNGSTSFSGDISGQGGFTKAGAGTLTLSGSNSYSGNTSISSGSITTGSTTALSSNSAYTVDGTLNVNNNNSIGSLAGAGTVNVSSSRILTSGGNNASTSFAGIIAGEGEFKKAGAGTLTLTASNTYSGNTTIEEGILALSGSGSITNTTLFIDTGANFDISAASSAISVNNLSGSGTLEIGANTLTESSSSATTFGGTLQGSGTFIKTGASTLTISGSSSSFSGTTQVTNGTLNLLGTLGGTTNISSGSTLKGTGTVNDLNNSGNVIPGASIGTLFISGDFTQDANGTLTIEISPTDNDLVDITGSATLDGTLSIISEPGVYSEGLTYTFLTADGGVSGTFASLTEDNAFNSFLTYEANSVTFTLGAPVVVTAVNNQTLTGNAKRVADYLFCPQATISGDLLNVESALVVLTGSSYEEALARLSPAQFKSINLALARNNTMVMTLALDQNNQFISGDMCSRGTYFIPIGSFQSQGSRNKQYGFNARNFGFLTGVEGCIGDHITLGGAFGYSYTNFGWKQDAGRAKVGSYYIGPYANATWNNFSIGTTLMGVFNDYHTYRKITFPGINRQADANHWGAGVSTRVSVQHFINLSHEKMQNLFLIPQIAGEYMLYCEKGYEETGANSINLHVQRTHESFFVPEANLTLLRACYPKENLRVTPSFGIGYRGFVVGPNKSLNASFINQNLCKPSFTTKGVSTMINQGTIDSSITIDNTEDLYFSLGFEYSYGGAVKMYEGSLQLEKKF